ncbi:MAG: response regulator transcription factor [Streptosporangiaceae bacterium]
MPTVDAMAARVLVAEDDEKQAELVRRYLHREGHEVVIARDGPAALAAVRSRPPDLLILDVMMPGIDGLDVCRVLRRDYAFPVLMLTARSAEDDLLLGLDVGADDYMTKPYSPRELMARVRALLRRAHHSLAVEDHVLRVGDLAVDPVRHEVRSGGRPVICTPAEFEILTAMAAQPERVFTRQQLLERTRGFDHYITERTADVHVMNLRKKIEPAPRRPVYLVTVFGVGYKLTDAGSSGTPGPVHA